MVISIIVFYLFIGLSFGSWIWYRFDLDSDDIMFCFLGAIFWPLVIFFMFAAYIGRKIAEWSKK